MNNRDKTGGLHRKLAELCEDYNERLTKGTREDKAPRSREKSSELFFETQKSKYP